MFDEDKVILLLAGLLLILLASAFVLSKQDMENWEKFSKEHNCKVIGKKESEIFNTFGVSGSGKLVVGIATSGQQTGWLCDDNVTYWRN